MSDDVSANLPKKALDITRDPTFVRLATDMVIVIDRSVDVELSLLALGPDPIQQLTASDEDGNVLTGETSLAPAYAEIGRVRLTPPVALSAAMNIVEKLIQAGRVNTDGFRRAIDDLIEQYSTTDDVEDSTE